MKKIVFFTLSLVLLLGLVIPSAVMAATESAPHEVNLIADQDIVVGKVQVWDDGTDLYVKYMITDNDWIITNTQLYVAKNPPPTSTPGQFPYNDDDASGVPDIEVLYVIPLNSIDSYSMQVNSKGKPTGVMIASGVPGVTGLDEVCIAAHAVVSNAPVGQATGIIYGVRSSAVTGGPKGLYQIDAVNGTFTLLKQITGGASDVNNGIGYTNALAFDPAGNKLYFTAPPAVNISPSPLWSYDITTGDLTKLGDITGSVVGACFYEGAYYYIAENTSVLMKIVDPSTAPFTPVAVQTIPDTATKFTFGDFVILPGGMLYGSTRVSPQMFFSLDITTGEYNVFAGSNSLDLQLAYGSNGILYGTNHGTGKFYTVDKATGTANLLPFIGKYFADLDSGTLFVPQSETGWGNGLNFGTNWGMYFEYELTSEDGSGTQG